MRPRFLLPAMAALLLLTARPSLATQPTLKGVALGETKGALLKRFSSLYCSQGAMPSWGEVCIYSPRAFPERPRIGELDTIAREPAASWSFYLANGKVGKIVATFDAASFDAMSTVLSELYRQAPMRGRDPVGRGARLMWVPSTNTYAFLTQQGTGPEGSMLSLEAAWFQDKLNAYSRTRTLDRAKDLQ